MMLLYAAAWSADTVLPQLLEQPSSETNQLRAVRDVMRAAHRLHGSITTPVMPSRSMNLSREGQSVASIDTAKPAKSKISRSLKDLVSAGAGGGNMGKRNRVRPEEMEQVNPETHPFKAITLEYLSLKLEELDLSQQYKESAAFLERHISTWRGKFYSDFVEGAYTSTNLEKGHGAFALNLWIASAIMLIVAAWATFVEMPMWISHPELAKPPLFDPILGIANYQTSWNVWCVVIWALAVLHVICSILYQLMTYLGSDGNSLINAFRWRTTLVVLTSVYMSAAFLLLYLFGGKHNNAGGFGNFCVFVPVRIFQSDESQHSW